MSDERRQEDRREEDMRLAEEVAKLEDSIKVMLDTRIAEEWEQAHAIHDRFAHRDHEHVEVTRLINVLEGTPRKMPSGEIVRDGGVLAELKEVTKAMRNGGVKIRLPTAAWVAIFVAVITGVFNVVAAIVDSSPPW